MVNSPKSQIDKNINQSLLAILCLSTDNLANKTKPGLSLQL